MNSILLLAACVCFAEFQTVSSGDERLDAVDVCFVSEFDQSEQRYVMMGLPGGAETKRSNATAQKTADSEQKPECRDVLIALHGHGSDRWQFIRDERDECRVARVFAQMHRMLYVSPDYRARTSWMGPAAEADLVQIIRELKEKYSIRHVFLCGGSMGGTSALIFAGLHPDQIQGVVSLNGTANMVEYTGFADAVAESYGGSRSEVPERYRERSPELSFEQLTMPVAMTVGGQDTLVPPDSCRRLSALLMNAGTPCLLIDHPDGGHASNAEDTLRALAFVRDAVLLKSQSAQ
ncbi:MAG: alpha/beta hydrolase [Planctomyces sp.]|nr:alpha/beta hydrolase [Planctomyces sp.]